MSTAMGLLLGSVIGYVLAKLERRSYLKWKAKRC